METITSYETYKKEYKHGVNAWKQEAITPSTWMEISLSALDENISHLRSYIGSDVGIMGVAKSDAYGLGINPIVERFVKNGIDKIAVANVSEIAQLDRENVVCLYPPQAWDIAPLVERHAEITVDTKESIELIAAKAKATGDIAKIHLMIETGMNRYGIQPTDALSIAQWTNTISSIKIEGICSHFATATRDIHFATQQLNTFLSVIRSLSDHDIHIPTVHIANSASIISLPDAFLPSTYAPFMENAKVFVRPGGLLYGVDRELAQKHPQLPMRDMVSAVYSHVAEVKDLLPGQSVGYGKRFTTEDTLKIATIPTGFGEGFLLKEGDVLINGKRCSILGLVASSAFAVSGTDQVERGDLVRLIGKDHDEAISLHDLANRNNLITMQLLTMLGSHIPRMYTETM